MSDLVERLREWTKSYPQRYDTPLMAEAADAIDQLEYQLKFCRHTLEMSKASRQKMEKMLLLVMIDENTPSYLWDKIDELLGDKDALPSD